MIIQITGIQIIPYKHFKPIFMSCPEQASAQILSHCKKRKHYMYSTKLAKCLENILHFKNGQENTSNFLIKLLNKSKQYNRSNDGKRKHDIKYLSQNYYTIDNVCRRKEPNIIVRIN